MRFGKLIKLWRAARGLSIREMAIKIGISAATLSRVERGEQCSGEVLRAVLHWLMAPEPKDAIG